MLKGKAICSPLLAYKDAHSRHCYFWITSILYSNGIFLPGALFLLPCRNSILHVMQEYLCLYTYPYQVEKSHLSSPSIHPCTLFTSTTTKIGAVFNVWVKSSIILMGVSLNDTLLVSLTIQLPLVDVLLRFHLCLVALMHSRHWCIEQLTRWLYMQHPSGF